MDISNYKNCWSDYTSIDQIIEQETKNKRFEAIKNMAAGVGLGIIGTIITIILMGA
jgi:hypothetical protein